jgi:uncharacterized membrane protein YozB (DUF420 family)
MQGFIPFARGSFMLDFVVLALLLVVPAVGFAIYQVRVRRNYKLHKWMQLIIGATLFIAVVLFEVEMRLVGWKHLAEVSPYYQTWVYPVLTLHITCAVLAVLSWSVTIIGAFRSFPSSDLAPTQYSLRHKRLGRFAGISLLCTALSGWLFYYLAFVAR